MTVTMDNEIGRDKVRNLKPWVCVLEIFSILLSYLILQLFLSNLHLFLFNPNKAGLLDVA